MDKKERFERYKYLQGLSSWEIASYQDKDNIVILNDGPSGLRKPIRQEFNRQEETIVTVCLPTPSSLAASFDKDLCYKNGTLLAKECLANKTNILLAPGVNIKSYVLCGRNFEYFSEDPYLAGILASKYINGIEDSGVGTCVKHYACNSQEYARTINSSELSLRALNEIYLRVFKYIFKYSKPTSVMTSYNKVNGEYVNESDYLINKKLRQEYKFEGLIMSDWCAVSNKWKAIATGMDLEMPISHMSDEYIDKGYQSVFDEKDLINRDNQIYKSIKKFKDVKQLDNLSLDDLHEEAVEIANKTIVLTKNNDNYLPFKKEDKILVLGYFASNNRFVGGGSGWVNSYKPKSFIDVLSKQNISYDFLMCYEQNKVLIDIETLKKYKGKYDKVILFLGQYQSDEEEGHDRSSLNLANEQMDVLEMVNKVFDNFATIVISGSVVNVKDVYNLSSALMITYLAGEGQQEAIFNNIYGLNNPSGRLPETWIESIYQNPINKEYLKRNMYFTYHYDDIYVGYRYYDINKNGFILPFGFGLSYSTFIYSNFAYKVKENVIEVSLDISNISDIDGEDVILIFVGKKDSNVYRPIKELKEFYKVNVKAKERKNIKMSIEIDNLKIYEDLTDSFKLEDGTYQIYIAKNANDIIDQVNVNLKGIVFEKIKEPKPLINKTIPKHYTVDSPVGLLFNNDVFKKYVIDSNLPIDLNDFENKRWYLDSKGLRFLINDFEFDITFEQLHDLIDHLNANNPVIDNRINFDEYVSKHKKLLNWEKD